MDNSNNQIKYKHIRTSASQKNIRPINISDDLIYLINTLNYDIKEFCQAVNQCLTESKLNYSELSPYEILQLIEQYLNKFIDKAKDTFKKMKYTQKINLIQQEINDYQNHTKSLKDEFLINNRNKILVDEVYIPSLCNNTSTSIKLNNYFNDNINNNINHNINNNQNKQHYKKINNHSYNKIKVNNINKNNLYGTNFNLRKKNKNINMLNNNKSTLENSNFIFHNYTRQFNNVKNKNMKDVNDIRKKILVNKISGNNNNNTSAPKVHYYSSNQTLNNINSPKKEILNSLSRIITILKELKAKKGNVFNQTWEAQVHQKLLYKLYYELNILVNNIFKDKDIQIENEDYLSGNTSDRSLSSKKEKANKNGYNYNLTYNYKIFNNSDEMNLFNENNKKKTKIFYEKEIKIRDTIIKKLKNEICFKDKNIQNLNIKYNQLLKLKLNNTTLNQNNAIKVNKIQFNEDNLNINKMSKIDIEELIESRKVIIDLKEKLKNYEKSAKIKNNTIKNYEAIIKKYNELKKVSDVNKINNERLKKQLNKTKFFDNLSVIQIVTFSINSSDEEKKAISEEAQKIINEIKNELQTQKETNEKISNENNIFKSNEITLKEEISKITEENNTLKISENKSKEEISKITNDINKLKEDIISMQKEKDLLNEKNDANINELKLLQETVEKQKKLLDYQDKEIISLKSQKEGIFKSNISDSYNNIINDNNDNSYNSNINKDKDKEDKKNKKRNLIKKSDLLQIEQDKIVLKYELLKNDYDKLNSTLQQKQKLLDNYSKITNETSIKTNIDEQILELIAEHKKEIDELTNKYNKNIINLKMNLPIGYSPSTHNILVDKKYSKYNLKWYLLTIITAEKKNYENTFWVPEDEIKPMLDQFNKFKTEKEIEDEQFESIFITQQKWIKQIDENEQLIAKLKAQLSLKYENSITG